ncbi:MAG: MFS transporter, partial [Mycobacterium sp.]
IGMAGIWAPLAATATRNLPMHLAGAGSGVYNATRQVGAVLGSAGMAAFMTSRISANLPQLPAGMQPGSGHAAGSLQLPEFLREPFAAAMSESTLLPASVTLFGVAAALFLVGFVITPARRTPELIDGPDDFDELDAPHVMERVSLPSRFAAVSAARDVDEPTGPIVAPSGQQVRREDAATEPLTVEILRVAGPLPGPKPIPLTHNGSHADDGHPFRPVVNGSPVPDVLAKFGITGNRPARRNRHHRGGPDDTDRIGGHSCRGDWR